MPGATELVRAPQLSPAARSPQGNVRAMFVKRRLRKLNLSADGCELMGAVQDPPVECSAGAIALGLDSGEVLLLCSETGSRRLSVSTERRGPVISVRLSEHGDAVAAVSRHGWQVLEVPSGHTQASVQLDAGRRVQLAVISPCLEKVAVSLGASTELGLYRFFSGEEESLPFRLSSRLACAAFGIDASQLASGDVEGGFRVWDASTGREVISVDSAHHGEILSLAFSSNGERIVSGGSDNSCKLWDACSGQPLQTFLGHTSKVTSVAFSPDGMHIASAGLDRSMYVWRADSATRLHILQGHDGRCPAPCAMRPGHAGRAHALSCTRVSPCAS